MKKRKKKKAKAGRRRRNSDMDTKDKGGKGPICTEQSLTLSRVLERSTTELMQLNSKCTNRKYYLTKYM
jgi:hypothetical protein